ncbi:outer membrane protein assembly factor BamB [Roseinatronobacter thiooxidans]|uniref:Outer membrane protein assembly factor BamB n=1 Tax=Roseinatronobacter thiooxidans TaxID=121821 RepID=A0A2W7S5R8_9RHOB|nr:PQQ-binding-like beta-propeller repeat protein [Roseinatronobacter thiooxidans]PZX45872.1 outer membrane protein assembly factor BamB [Roseinatronobacter thiooxidans]
MKLWTCASLLALTAFIAACDRGFVLEGERFALRAPFSENAGEAPDNRALPISLPASAANAEWTHRLGSPSTRITHPALGGALQQAWSVPIGQGDGRRHRITAEPVASGGLVYTLDSRAQVTAVTSAGAVAWTRDLTPDFTRSADSASGGGLAIADGKLFVTSAFGMLWALDLATGAEVWSKRFDAPLTAAPTIAGGALYVVASDSTAWALDAATGQTDWQLAGAPSPSSMVGGAAPAVTGELVLFPTSAGELIAARRDTGQIVWRRAVAGTRIGVAYASVTDVTGDPVVQGDVVYVGNQSGRVMALNRSDGRIIWTADEAAYGPVWPVGGSVFLMSDRNRLVRLDAGTGEFIWAESLPLFTETRERRRAGIFPHYGPVLAGGRLIVGSGDGALRSFDPASGALVAETELRSGAAIAPIVVGGTLYVVSRDGRLTAYR